MREIEYRAWDKKNKTMWAGEGLENFNYYINPRFGTIVKVQNIHSCEEEDCHDVKLGSVTMDNFILMQSTGLKDKNGKKIYEGDILRSGHTDSIEGIVKYQAPEFIIQLPRRRTWTAFILTPEQNQFQEIAGNIYENPDLLQ